MKLLITGGAGFIGSVVVEQLIEMGEEVIVFDNLSSGHEEAVHPDAKLIVGDLADLSLLAKTFTQHKIDGIMHFASNTMVGESMVRPFLYLGDNVINGLNLLQVALENQVKYFILSSTASLFDSPEQKPVSEKDEIVPGSPYGESKYILERMLYWLDRTKGLRYAVLRYFNTAGATPTHGEDRGNLETHLIPLVLRVALGEYEKITIFGNDYPTPDGTCIRDYIHVLDLAQAHILVLHALGHGRSRIYNLGSSRGYSVNEVVETARRITSHPIPTEVGPRRPGDLAYLIASSDAIKRELGWKPKHSDLETIISDGWSWLKQHPNGYAHKT